jgi:hypothetical protein
LAYSLWSQQWQLPILLSEVAHLSRAEASQERIESVVGHFKIVDACKHFALCLEGPSTYGVEAGGRKILGFIGTVFAVRAMVK